MAPLTMYEEKNTGTNLPAEIKIAAVDGDAYKFLFIAKGGGSANKSYLYQETKALLNEATLLPWIFDKMQTLGTVGLPAVPPRRRDRRHVGRVRRRDRQAGLDALPRRAADRGLDRRARLPRRRAGAEGARARPSSTGIGAQFGGKYFCHDVRIVRLPRHGASCPVGMAVSCSADRQAKGKITRDGVFLEQLETDPARFLPDDHRPTLDDDAGRAHRPQPADGRASAPSCRKYPVKTRVMLTGPMVVARDIAHAKIKERLDAGEGMPQYLKDHCVYYAGPAKTPEGYASGSFGPTTAGRMDSYVEEFQAAGGSMVMLAKGNRSQAGHRRVRRRTAASTSARSAARRPAWRSTTSRKVEVLEYPELGMEAVWKIEVVDFPAFIVVDDKGNDFFEEVRRQAKGIPVTVALTDVSRRRRRRRGRPSRRPT